MLIRCHSFGNESNIPSKFTCDGENINPALEINEVANGTKSLVLICDDPDAPSGLWVHWVVYNIDPETKFIPENWSLPENVITGINSFGENKYGGPCPPGGTHRYFFKIYSLDIEISEKDLKADALLQKMAGHILEKAQIIGLYSRN